MLYTIYNLIKYMLSPSELKSIYSESELLNLMVELKTQRASLLTGGSVSSVQTRDLSVSYGVPATMEGIDVALATIAKALQMLNPETYGTDLLRLRRKYII